MDPRQHRRKDPVAYLSESLSVHAVGLAKSIGINVIARCHDENDNVKMTRLEDAMKL